MSAIESKYQNEIEVERLWVTTALGKSVLLMMPFALLIVIALWETASHRQLLAWLAFSSLTHLLRWSILNYYRSRKDRLAANIKRYKAQVLLAGLLTSAGWVLCIVQFLDANNPANVLFVCLPPIIQAVGAMMTWFAYYPAVLSLSIPPSLTVALALLHEGLAFWAAAVTILILPFLSYYYTQKFSIMLDHALTLGFENAALRQEAERANAAKTRFLATASHDLRQPIHALGLFFGELSERVRDPDNAQLIGQIDDSIAAVNAMLSALLDVSKLDAGVVKPEVLSCFPAEIFDRLDAEFQPLARENRNAIRFRPCRHAVATDSAMLERMLRNLIGNALRYTENGRVLVGTRLRGGDLEILVIDTGPGIPEDQLPEIFVEFHQLHNPGRNRQQGLGLGLAIVKRLARLLGHPIQVRSRVGKGSCFSLRVPLAAVASPIHGERQTNLFSPSVTCLHGKQVLLLDDDQNALQSMSGLLSHWGCRVAAASSLAGALELLAGAETALNLLIVDYRLADSLSGIEAAREIQCGLGYRFEVLVVTGDTGPERLRDAEASGFPLLHKPVHPAKLRATLQHLFAVAHQ